MSTHPDRPLSVLHIGKYFPPFRGGMEAFLADLVQAQAAQGLRVGALVHDHSRGRVAPEEVLPIVGPYPAQLWRVPSYGQLLYAPVSPAFPVHLWRVLRELRPDVLHLHLPNTSAFWPLFFPRARRLPWVIHWHADVIATPGDGLLDTVYPLYAPFERAMLRHSQAVIVTSPPYCATSRPLESFQSRCEIVPLGINPARLPEPSWHARAWAERQWCRDAGFLRVLFVGRITPYKGLEVLAQALMGMTGVRVLVVGDGEGRGALALKIQSLGVGEGISLLGSCHGDRLRGLYQTCDCLCLPSLERSEAFGVVLMEAMRYGKALVTTAIPGSGVGWVNREGVTGLTVPVGDPMALADALARLRDHPDLAARLGRQGAREFGRRFHI
ncbi:MAG: glycosyltransferase, partial [Pseudomonadota bacterium]